MKYIFTRKENKLVSLLLCNITFDNTFSIKTVHARCHEILVKIVLQFVVMYVKVYGGEKVRPECGIA